MMEERRSIPSRIIRSNLLMIFLSISLPIVVGLVTIALIRTADNARQIKDRQLDLTEVTRENCKIVNRTHAELWIRALRPGASEIDLESLERRIPIFDCSAIPQNRERLLTTHKATRFVCDFIGDDLDKSSVSFRNRNCE